MNEDLRQTVTLREGPPHAGVGATFCGRPLLQHPGGLVERGIGAVIRDAVAAVAQAAARTYLTVDIDVLDSAFAPGTGTPEPGGMTTRELLWALGHASEALDLCAADVVEVCPPADPQGITALAAERAAVELLSGMAARRRAGGSA